MFALMMDKIKLKIRIQFTLKHILTLFITKFELDFYFLIFNLTHNQMGLVILNFLKRWGRMNTSFFHIYNPSPTISNHILFFSTVWNGLRQET